MQLNINLEIGPCFFAVGIFSPKWGKCNTTILESKNGNLHIFLNDFTFHESSLIISIYTDK